MNLLAYTIEKLRTIPINHDKISCHSIIQSMSNWISSLNLDNKMDQVNKSPIPYRYKMTNMKNKKTVLVVFAVIATVLAVSTIDIASVHNVLVNKTITHVNNTGVNISTGTIQNQDCQWDVVNSTYCGL